MDFTQATGLDPSAENYREALQDAQNRKPDVDDRKAHFFVETTITELILAGPVRIGYGALTGCPVVAIVFPEGVSTMVSDNGGNPFGGMTTLNLTTQAKLREITWWKP